MQYFTRKTINSIEYYVYGLRYPGAKKYFYIGKGKGNRVFSHVKQKIKRGINDPKYDIINSINDKNGPEIVIIRHKLTEVEALKIEASLIDVLGVKQIANKVQGHNTDKYGIMSPYDIAALYKGKKFIRKDPCICFKINKAWHKNMTEKKLYDAIRGTWRVSSKSIKKVKYGIGVSNGVIRGIYRINRWRHIESRNRWRFQGIKDEKMQKYIGYSLIDHPNHKVSGPLFYINLNE